MPTKTDHRLSTATIRALVEARHDDPFAVLGPHEAPGGVVIRALVPGAARLEVVEEATGAVVGELTQRHEAGLFEGLLDGPAGLVRLHAARRTTTAARWDVHDPYRYPPVLGRARRLSDPRGHAPAPVGAAGRARDRACRRRGRAFRGLGAERGAGLGGRRLQRLGRPAQPDAPRAAASGVWEIFIPGARRGRGLQVRAARRRRLAAAAQGRPARHRRRAAAADRLGGAAGRRFHAGATRPGSRRRAAAQSVKAPISILEVHLGSWARGEGNRFLTYDELADRLVPYAVDLGFTHLELLPINEHPFDGSWGYQPIGLFAPTSRHGSPRDFARFVDRCHAAGLGLLLDWVPGHFPTDAHGLGRFDGTALYEHEDPRQGFHQDWSTLIYNFGRTEVANFLHANALFWLDRYHVDGLRVDAVASMLYLDYSRKADEWVPNKFGGRENLEAVDFLRRMNELAYGEHPGIMTVAEESTAWPGVSRPTWTGGLGFGFKWNMGWMHDTLEYMGKEPAHRRWHHHQMTFGLLYAFSENFVLPLSHDEVVHGKGSILARMPGDAWQKFANLRAYYGFMWGHPGKKLLFMGQEFAPGRRVERRAEPGLASARDRLAQGRAAAGQGPEPDVPRGAGPASARLRRQRLRLGRGQRRRELGVRLAAPRRARHALGAGGQQLHADPARGLPGRPAGLRRLARAAQHRCRGLWRLRHGQSRPHRGRGGALARPVLLGRGHLAAAGDAVLRQRELTRDPRTPGRPRK